MKTIYTAHANTVGAREGHAETDDKKLSVHFALPGNCRQCLIWRNGDRPASIPSPCVPYSSNRARGRKG